MFYYSALAVFGLCYMFAVLGKIFRVEIFAEQIFAELIFAILAINLENKFREAYKILNNREKLSRKIWWYLD